MTLAHNLATADMYNQCNDYNSDYEIRFSDDFQVTMIFELDDLKLDMNIEE